MDVRVTVGLSGADFSIAAGTIIDRDELARLVGADSYLNVSEPAEPTANAPEATLEPAPEPADATVEITDAPPAANAAVKPPARVKK